MHIVYNIQAHTNGLRVCVRAHKVHCERKKQTNKTKIKLSTRRCAGGWQRGRGKTCLKITMIRTNLYATFTLAIRVNVDVENVWRKFYGICAVHVCATETLLLCSARCCYAYIRILLYFFFFHFPLIIVSAETDSPFSYLRMRKCVCASRQLRFTCFVLPLAARNMIFRFKSHSLSWEQHNWDTKNEQEQQYCTCTHFICFPDLNARHKSIAFSEKQQKEEKMFIENRSIMNPNGTSRIHPTDCSHTCAMHCITSAIFIIIYTTMHSIHTYIHCPWSLVNYEWWKMVCSKHARNRLLRIHSMRCGAHAHYAYTHTHTNTHI